MIKLTYKWNKGSMMIWGCVSIEDFGLMKIFKSMNVDTYIENLYSKSIF
jgi:hypothetical protein